MTNLIVIAAIVFVVLIVLALAAKALGGLGPGPASAPEMMPYVSRKSPLTANEREFYFALHEALRGLPFVIMPQLSLQSVASVRKGTENRQSWKNKVDRKSVDFVVCDNESLRTALVIEVDDASHRGARRVERDQFVDRLCLTIDLPLLRVPARPHYSSDEIRTLVMSALG